MHGPALGQTRGQDVRAVASEVTHRREIVGSVSADHDLKAVDRSDQTFLQVTVLVTSGLELFTRELVEPESEREAQHDGPFVLGDPDDAPSDAHGAGDDVLSHLLHPPQVSVTVSAVAPVDSVGAGDRVDLAGLVVAVELVPPDAVEAADGVRRGVDASGLARQIDREVERVRAGTC